MRRSPNLHILQRIRAPRLEASGAFFDEQSRRYDYALAQAGHCERVFKKLLRVPITRSSVLMAGRPLRGGALALGPARYAF